jgi:tRNA 2-thiocytidine biosynthesis protein TtcA
MPSTGNTVIMLPTDRTQRSERPSKVAKKLSRIMMQTVQRWQLIEEGDRILVAVSGGKDSYSMLDLLCAAQRRAPIKFELVAVHLDQGQPGYDGEPLRTWLEASAVSFEIVREDTYAVVIDKTEPGQSYCVVCSRLRRGVLYSVAERLGCNKLALGHHRDDALETLLMNLFYAGRLQAMPARYQTDDGKFTVIRPLIDTAESDIRTLAAERGYPILPCNLCGSQDGMQRDAMAALLVQLEASSPNLRAVMHNAISNVKPSHLLDVDLNHVWANRDQSVQPKPLTDVGPRRMTGTLVAQRPLSIGGQLRIVNDNAG